MLDAAHFLMSPQTVHQFAEKVALISDAGSPVGRAAAIQLALQGSYVIGLFPGEGGSLSELVELGTLAHAFNADPSTAAGAAAAADEVERLFGRLDLLVNCLKFKPESAFNDLTEPGFTDTVRINLGSVHFLTNAVLRLMNGRPKPKIVNIAWSDREGGDALFAASQAGIVSLTGSMARELPPKFRTNCVEVPLEPPAAENEGGLLLRSPSAVAPDDVARTILFLLSSESIGMNGQVIRLG